MGTLTALKSALSAKEQGTDPIGSRRPDISVTKTSQRSVVVILDSPSEGKGNLLTPPIKKEYTVSLQIRKAKKVTLGEML